MSKEAEEWIRDNHINGDANIGRQFIGYDGQPEVCYDPLSTILEAYAKHYALKMLRDEKFERLLFPPDTALGSFHYERKGARKYKDELIKRIEDE